MFLSFKTSGELLNKTNLGNINSPTSLHLNKLREAHVCLFGPEDSAVSWKVIRSYKKKKENRESERENGKKSARRGHGPSPGSVVHGVYLCGLLRLVTWNGPQSLKGGEGSPLGKEALCPGRGPLPLLLPGGLQTHCLFLRVTEFWQPPLAASSLPTNGARCCPSSPTPNKRFREAAPFVRHSRNLWFIGRRHP